MANKSTSAKDVVTHWETVHAGQKFEVKEFEGENGVDQFALVNLTTRTVTVQFEGDKDAAFDKLYRSATELLSDSKVIVAKEPVDSQMINSPLTDKEREDLGPVPADEAWQNLPKNDHGQVEIDESGNVVGTESDKGGTVATNPQAAEANAS